jgi:hypothetical protein
LGKKKDGLYYTLLGLATKTFVRAEAIIGEMVTDKTPKGIFQKGIQVIYKGDFYYPDLLYYFGITLAEEVKSETKLLDENTMPETARLAIEYVSKAIREKPILLLAKREAKIPPALYYPSFYSSILLKSEILEENKEANNYPWLEIGIYKNLPAEMQNNPEMIYLLGICYLKLDQYGDAISICNDLTIRAHVGDAVCKILAERLFKKIFEEIPKKEEKKEGGQTQPGATPVVPPEAPLPPPQ